MKRLYASITASIACAALLVPGMVSALTFSPPTLDIAADPGQTLERTIKLSNESAVSENIVLSTANFTGKSGDETRGVPDFYPSDEERDGHGLGRWISFKKTDYTLLPGESVEAPFVVSIPTEAGPGSYFGAVIMSIHSNEAARNVGVIGSAAALVFLRVNGEVVEKLELDAFSAPAFSANLPIRFDARVRNEGTVHLRPYGEVTVKNLFGRTVATLAMNRLEYKSVLPGTARRYATVWAREALDDRASTLERQWKNFALGPYTAELTLHYGADDHAVYSEKKFWVVPWLILLLFGGGSTLLILVLRAFLRWNRGSMMRHQESR